MPAPEEDGEQSRAIGIPRRFLLGGLITIAAAGGATTWALRSISSLSPSPSQTPEGNASGWPVTTEPTSGINGFIYQDSRLYIAANPGDMQAVDAQSAPRSGAIAHPAGRLPQK
ncbi:hypothetical protein Acor_36240 [Acrocarpospora corrugata]|uniref:Uncharacterized protein n=1 Tax=Acrocarpospora corrugata TaxID=35763 RepID=A0A5M3W022_9ACTN|nr:hypothetical protein Acor_36240 [Acrocarpospora corrugata]